MKSPTDFEEFWNKLTEHEIWFEQMKMRYYKKDLRGTGNDCFIFLLASEHRWKAQDWQDFRKCYQSFLIKAPDMVAAPQLQQTEVKEEKPLKPEDEPIKKSDPRYMQHLNNWLASLKEVENNFAMPQVTKEQAKAEGQWDKPKAPVYRSDQDDFLYHLRNNIKKFAAKKYKGYYKWDGFKHYQIGLVTVYAESMNDAQEILKSSERLTTLQQRKTKI